MSASPAWLEQFPDGVLIRVQAQPKASKSEVSGLHGEPPRLKIRVAAPPVEGEANEELLRFLKKTLRGPGVQLELVRGHSSKSKDVFCRGLSLQEIASRLLP